MAFKDMVHLCLNVVSRGFLVIWGGKGQIVGHMALEARGAGGTVTFMK